MWEREIVCVCVCVRVYVYIYIFIYIYIYYACTYSVYVSMSVRSIICIKCVNKHEYLSLALFGMTLHLILSQSKQVAVPPGACASPRFSCTRDVCTRVAGMLPRCMQLCRHTRNSTYAKVQKSLQKNTSCLAYLHSLHSRNVCLIDQDAALSSERIARKITLNQVHGVKHVLLAAFQIWGTRKASGHEAMLFKHLRMRVHLVSVCAHACERACMCVLLCVCTQE